MGRRRGKLWDQPMLTPVARHTVRCPPTALLKDFGLVLVVVYTVDSDSTTNSESETCVLAETEASNLRA